MLTHQTIQKARRLSYQTPGEYSPPPYKPTGKPQGRTIRVRLSLLELPSDDIQIHKE